MRNRILFKTAVLLLISALVLSSCGGNRKPKDRTDFLPNITGNSGEVLVVVSKGYWEGELGSTLRKILAGEYPFLPQREPVFKLFNATPGGFTGSYMLHRNIVIVNVSPEVDTTGVRISADAWAKPQVIVTVSATTPEEATELIVNNSELIINTIEQAERDRIITNSKRYEETALRPVVCQFAGGSPYFPSGYKLLKQTDDFIWIAYGTKTQVQQHILVYKFPVTGEDDFSPENLLEKRNEYLKNNVPGMFENTYMTTSNIITPSVEYLKYRGRDFAEMRGFWEVFNDYMGGPFVSQAFYSPDGQEIIVLDGFVYAPKYDKRNYMREVESILYSFEWNNSGRKE